MCSSHSSSNFVTPVFPRGNLPGTPFGRRGTSSSSRTPQSSTPRITDLPDSFMVAALVQGRGHSKNEIGMAAMSLKSTHLYLTQFTDSPTFVRTMAKLRVFNPAKVAVPETMADPQNNAQAVDLLRQHFPRIALVNLPRNYFDENRGIRSIQQLCSQDYLSTVLLVTHKYYSLAAASALLRYIEINENMVFAKSSLRLEFQSAESTMLIDAATAQRLELTSNLTQAGGPSLYSALNHCRIASGSRLLRSTLLEPPRELGTIFQRLTCVEELISKPELFYALQGILGRFVDVDALLWQCVQIPKQGTPSTSVHQLNSVIALKHTLELIPHLCEALGLAENSYMVQIREETKDPRYEALLKKIEQVLSTEVSYTKSTATMRAMRHFAIKPNVNEYLDVARRAYIELLGDAQRLTDRLVEEFQLPITRSENATRGFHFQMPLTGRWRSGDTNALPECFIQVQKHKRYLTFTTEEMAVLDNRIKETVHDMDLFSGSIISTLLDTIREDISCLYKLSDALSRLDLFVAFAHVSSIGRYQRPQFDDTYAVVKGRHPILDRCGEEQPIPNDTFLSSEIFCQVITGPNMSGKTTYLRQVALLQIMAQVDERSVDYGAFHFSFIKVGCFVPVDFGRFRLTDQIFSRLGSQESIECNASSFMVEMLELSYIVQNATHLSLIIIDELGKHTSPEEGCALSWAITEDLLKKRAFVVLATHFMPMTKLAEVYFNVTNFHTEVVEEEADGETRLRPTFEIKPGTSEIVSYGLKLAEAANLPRDFLTQAKQMREDVAANYKLDLVVDPEYKVQKECFSFAYNLFLLSKQSDLDAEAKRACMIDLKKKFQDVVANNE